MARTVVILVSGTHGMLRERAWWRPQSDLARALRERTFHVPSRSFVWTTDLEGVAFWRKHRTWAVAGENLWTHVKNYCSRRDRVVVIGHSHGGNVIAYSAKFGARYDTVITLAMPSRKDMLDEYERLRERARRWVHIYHKGDWIQRAGSAVGLGWLTARRDVPINGVENVEMHEEHGDLLTPADWDAHNVWQYLAPPSL